MNKPFLAHYFKTLKGAKSHVIKHITQRGQFAVIGCGRGYLVVSGEIYKKYFTK